MKISSFSASSSTSRKRLVDTASCSSNIVLPTEITEEELQWKNGLPPGVKFVPTQEELICYLLKKVYTGSIEFGGVIRDIDLYKYEPEDLKALAFEGERRLYFFTPLQKRYTNGTRKKRETVHGFWKGSHKTKTVQDGDNKPTITKTPFCYFHPRGKNAMKTQWLMDEFRLKNHDNHQVMLENWALCVVHYKKRGGDGNNEEKEDDRSSNIRNKSSRTDSRSEATGSISQRSMIGSASDDHECALAISAHNGSSRQTPTPSRHNIISFGYNNSSVDGPSSQPQSNWSRNINPNKSRQQCSISDQPLLTRPNFNIASFDENPPSHAHISKRTPSGIGSPNYDQHGYPSLADSSNPNCSNMSDLFLNNNASGDQMLSDYDYDDSIYSELRTLLQHEETPHPSLPQQRDDYSQKINPSINLTVPAPSSPFPPSS